MLTGSRRCGCAAPAAALLIAAVALAGCNATAPVNRRPHTGSTTASAVGGVQQVTVTAGDTYRFDPSTITVHPGTVRITLVNDGGGAPHNWTVLGMPAAATTTVGGGARASASFTAPTPGSYTFVCTIHRKQGQTGTLVVLAQ